MEGCDGSDIGFRHGGGDFLNFPRSGMTPSSVLEEVSGMAINPFVSSGWDPLVSLTQGYHYANPSLASGPFSAQLGIMENRGTAADFPPPLGHNLSALTEQVSFSRFPCSESRSHPNAVGYFGLPDIASSGCAPNYGSHGEDDHDGSEGASANNGLSQGCRIKEDAEGSSPSVKRRKIASGHDPIYDWKEDVKKDPSGVNSDVPKEWDEKKQKNEKILCPSSQGKQNGKQVKDNVEAPKENYIHVRARRGQATNSHSLAERVRREKISERMRMLQELVPGCNKITGKAVMLDEIINYVQSLQQQVEFLSMKLAAVSPELSINLERILSKDIFCSQGSSATTVGTERGMASTCPYTQGFFPEAFPSIPSLNHHYPPLTQAFCESELQTHCQLGFHSSSGVDSLELDGRLKSEK